MGKQLPAKPCSPWEIVMVSIMGTGARAHGCLGSASVACWMPVAVFVILSCGKAVEEVSSEAGLLSSDPSSTPYSYDLGNH